MVKNGLLWLSECTSTNDEAMTRIGDPSIRAVASDHQTAGRGRLGRPWFSPPGYGLYMSWIARPRFSQAMGSAIPLLAAAAAAEVCANLGIRPILKWPNDLLVGQRKLAGILCEAQGSPNQWTAVVGIGLNLRTPEEGWPVDVPATALDVAIDETPTPLAMAEELLKRFESWLARVEEEGLSPVIEAWRTYGPAPGTPMAQGKIRGGFAGLAPDGSLRLQTRDGIVTIHAGDVELVSGGN
jgi:BirA family biotin operon repressor/biotin-[acetyl-CoA-carboxylase] ligase